VFSGWNKNQPHHYWLRQDNSLCDLDKKQLMKSSIKRKLVILKNSINTKIRKEVWENKIKIILVKYQWDLVFIMMPPVSLQ
jgi:hypothetical protein